MNNSDKLWMATPITTPDNKTMVTVVADGSTDQFEINFPGGYLARSHILGFMLAADSAARTELTITFIRENLVKVAPFPPAGSSVTIYRDTPKEVPLVNFTDGAMIAALNLDRNARQCIFAVAEMLDRYQVVFDQVTLAELYAKAAANSAGQAEASAAFVEEIFNKFKLTDELMAEIQELARQSADSATAARDSADRAEGAAGATNAASNLYATREEAQVAFSEGKLVEGQFLFVISPDDDEISVLYRVVNSVVTVFLDSLGRQKEIPSKLAIDGYLAQTLDKILVSEVPNGMAQVNDEWVAGVGFADGSVSPFMRDNGRLITVNSEGEVSDVGLDSDFVEKFVAVMGATNLPDGKQLSKAVVNDSDEIVEAWTTDGSYYVFSESGLVPITGGGGVTPEPEVKVEQTVYNSAVNFDFMNWGTTRLSAAIASSLPGGRPNMYIIGTFGQSLAQAFSEDSTDTLVATTTKYPNNAWMFKSSNPAASKSPRRGAGQIDDLESLVDTVSGGLKETVGSSFTSHLIDQIERSTGERIHVLHFVASTGGQPWRGLMKGTNAWSVLEQSLIDAARICKARGYNPVFLGVDVKAGESDTDQTGSMTAPIYARYLQRMDLEINLLSSRVFGRGQPAARLFVEQCSFQPHAAGDGRVRFGQYMAHGLGNVVFTGASYQYDHTGDVIHINSKGQNSRGVQLARAVGLECFGVGYEPLLVRECYWTSPVTIDFTFTTQGELIKDTSNAIVQTAGLGEGGGFRIVDRMAGNAVLDILSAEMVTAGRLRITINNPTNTRNVNITYASARTIAGPGSGPVVGARGLFRSKNGTPNLYTAQPEYIWLPAFNLELM